jgi:flagellar protein FliO/FliZ
VGDQWLVLGAGPGNVRLLHTMPAGSTEVENVAESQTLSGSFGQRFSDALKSEANKRFEKFKSK